MIKQLTLILVWSAMLAVPATLTAQTESRISTPQDRRALFNYLLDKTLEREAFSPIKNQRLGLDVEKAMRAFENEIVAASTESELFYALVKLSNARKDRHLTVSAIDGGLRPDPNYSSSANSNYPDLDAAEQEPPTAPIRFAVDFSQAPNHFSLFVADLGDQFREDAGGLRSGLIVTGINDLSISDFVSRVRPYFRYSTENGFWTKLAQALHQRTPILPRSFYRGHLDLRLSDGRGQNSTVSLPYISAQTIVWQGISRRKYSEFQLIRSGEVFDLYRHRARKVLLISWKGFGDALIEEIDSLMEWASKAQLLDYNLVWDGTRSRGGGQGAYAIQRLSPKPFKTTFGNLRLSDVVPEFVDGKRRQFKADGMSDGVRETIDDGSWLMEWLEGDVMQGLAAGQAYSNDVPFKTAHAPAWSDGRLNPTKVHFRGEMVCLFGPYGGSHLDQFAAIVIDNGLCTTLGMPAGGYSNTWEWEEDVRFPLSNEPVVKFMWSIGHTIRPNGQILEGNPAEVDEFLPLTRENYRHYHDRLLARALKVLER